MPERREAPTEASPVLGTELKDDELEILQALADEARLTNTELAQRLTTPPSTSLYRLQRLIDRGVITGFHTAIDQRALGVGLNVLMTVQLVDLQIEHRRAFLTRVAEMPQVLAIMRVSGTDGFVLQVAVPSSDALMLEVTEPLLAMPEVRATNTRMIGEAWERHSPLGEMRRTAGPADLD